MIIVDTEQLSDSWFALRCGIPTASNFDKIVTSTGERSKQRKAYMHQLAGESLLGYKEETYQNAAMLRGIELEPDARRLYERVKNVKVEQIGFLYADELENCGCSPDGSVNNHHLLFSQRGIIEIKCPLLHTHVQYLLANRLPVKYVQQVQGELFIMNRSWVDFISYYPGMPSLIVRVERDESFISKLASELESFCSELAELIKKLRRM